MTVVDVERLRNDVEAVAARATGDIGIAIDLPERTPGHVSVNRQRRFPAASIMKLAVLFALLARVDKAELDLDDVVTLDRTKDVGGFGVLIEMPAVERLTVRELATLMIAFSDNTASNACIELAGLEHIDASLSANGLHETRVERRLMDFEAEAAGLRNEVSAGDAARLVRLLVCGDVFRKGVHEFADEVLLDQRIRDRLPRHLDPRIVIGNKTGEVPGVRHDVGILRYGGRSVAVAVLTQGFTDARTAHCVDGGYACDLIADIGRLVGAHLVGEAAVE